MKQSQEEFSEVNARLPDGAAAALESLLHSQTFVSRPRLREFLEFVGTAALEGRANEIKEQAIGVKVFGRPKDYSVHDDTIVRVTARQLRQKLAEYHMHEGRTSALTIEIPRGTYVPVFREREQATEFQPAPLESGDQVGGGPRDSRTTKWLGWAVALGLSVLCAVLLAALAWQKPVPGPTLLGLLQSSPAQTVSVVCGDGVVQVFKDLTGEAPTLEAYESNAYLVDPKVIAVVGENNPVWEELKHRQLLASGSLQSLTRLVRAMPEGHISARHPREVTVRDFVDGSAILLSGPFANPWVQLFEPRLNFRIVQDETHQVYIHNVHPEPGELNEYRLRNSDEKRISYARLAFMPNLGGKGRVLLIGGPSSTLMELMGSAVSDPGFLRQMAERFGAASPEALPYCEILMEVEEMASAPVKTRVVAVRRLDQATDALK